MDEINYSPDDVPPSEPERLWKKEFDLPKDVDHTYFAPLPKMKKKENI